MNIQSSFYRSVNGIERAPRSNLARLPAISSFWTLFVGIGNEVAAKLTVDITGTIITLQAFGKVVGQIVEEDFPSEGGLLTAPSFALI